MVTRDDGSGNAAWLKDLFDIRNEEAMKELGHIRVNFVGCHLLFFCFLYW